MYVPKYCSMIEPHRTMQHLYTVHQTLPFCCRGGSGSQDYSGMPLLMTTILVLSSEVSLSQGEIKFMLNWDSVKCADYLSVLISGVSFKRGSTECLLGSHNISKRVYITLYPVLQSELVSAKFPLTRLSVSLVLHEISSPMLSSSVMQTKK